MSDKVITIITLEDHPLPISIDNIANAYYDPETASHLVIELNVAMFPWGFYIRTYDTALDLHKQIAQYDIVKANRIYNRLVPYRA